MVGIGLRNRWARALLVALIAAALLLAPVAGAQAMHCDDHTGHPHTIAEQSQAVHHQDGLSQAYWITDAKACCGTACSVFQIVIGKESAELLHLVAARLRFEWSDQFGSGIAFPPTLGPPRFPV